MRIKFLTIFLLIAINLIAVELVLEIRAVNRGFSGFLLEIFASSIETSKPLKEKFEFRSAKIDLEKPENSLRIWMASASYAEDYKRKIDELFPNVLCREVNIRFKKKCQMLNASKAGYSIQGNIDQLKTSATHWKPDYVLLYSMSLDVNYLSDKFLNSNFDSIENDIAKEGNNSRPAELTIDRRIEKTIEQMAAYGHLRTYLGGSALLSKLLYDDIGIMAKRDFKNILVEFIEASKEIDAIPVLITFATAYDTENFQYMPHKGKLFLVRYNSYLSDEGWVNTIKAFNEIIRSTASEQDVHYIDLEKSLSGKTQYFTDFVHFTKEGHEFIGEKIASDFIKIFKRHYLIVE